MHIQKYQCQKLSVLAKAIKVHIPIGNQGVDFVNRIYTEDNSVPFPEASLEDESSPGNFGLEMSFRIDGYIGTSKDVPKFNNLQSYSSNLTGKERAFWGVKSTASDLKIRK